MKILNRKNFKLPFRISASRALLFLVIVFWLWFVLAWLAAGCLIVERKLDKADVVLILGGSAAFEERTEKAAEIYHQQRAPKIFLTDDGERGGWNSKEQRNPFFVERARWHLLELGVSADAIEILPKQVNSTYDEAVLFREEASKHQLKSVIIVTSVYHTRRAFWTFSRNSVNDSFLIGIESPPVGQQSPLPQTWWWYFRGWNFVGGEFLKLGYYWLFY
jgi:uncharacterized SAM-binding protein YcdF (DUF218 family)